ncbi:hypothetical protein B620_gp56 [Croceibacter phage P2559S]|uniref:hypothetical protein n=1 Tax=Croceibacter phage P2559S TaxID=1176422 RepID=UPI0002688ED3|nr:hypothetical protein B620_gp56 [Croceibacter phage P2559S]AFM54834.1 hypothetical protein P2559S_56 [Croceibacter phage P2559S]
MSKSYLYYQKKRNEIAHIINAAGVLDYDVCYASAEKILSKMGMQKPSNFPKSQV